MFDHQAPFTHSAARLARVPARFPRAQLTTASGKRGSSAIGVAKTSRRARPCGGPFMGWAVSARCSKARDLLRRRDCGERVPAELF